MGTITKLAATVVGARVAGASNKYGLIGVAAGALAARAVVRWPPTALRVGGAYAAKKMQAKKEEIDVKGPRTTAISDGLVEPGSKPVTEPSRIPDQA